MQTWLPRNPLKRIDPRLLRALYRRGRRRVLFEFYNDFGLAGSRGILDALSGQSDVDLRFTATQAYHSIPPDEVEEALRTLGWGDRYLPPERAGLQFWDLVVRTDRAGRTRYLWPSQVLLLAHGGVSGADGLGRPYTLRVIPISRCTAVFVESERAARYLASQDPELMATVSVAVTGWHKLDELYARPRATAEEVRRSGLVPGRKTVLVASHWSASSLVKSVGPGVVERLRTLDDLNVVLTCHNLLLRPDMKHFSDGVDWFGVLEGWADLPHMHARRAADSTDLLRMADVLVSDHSSISFEFTAVDRPIVFFRSPDWEFLGGELGRLVQEACECVADSGTTSTSIRGPRRAGPSKPSVTWWVWGRSGRGPHKAQRSTEATHVPNPCAAGNPGLELGLGAP